MVDDGTKEENMDEGPNEKSPRCGSDVSLFAMVVDTLRSGNGVDV